jgi:hypothetical protein
MEWKKKWPRVLRGATGNLRPGHVWLAGYVRAIGQTCPVKTASAVSKTSKISQKIDIQWILA